jgi:hypothetical protein
MLFSNYDVNVILVVMHVSSAPAPAVDWNGS